MKEIYIARDGNQIGPFSEEQIKGMLDNGMLKNSDSAWHSGLDTWGTVDKVIGYPTEDTYKVPTKLPDIQDLPANISQSPYKISIGAMYLLIILTHGSYFIYWNYRQWKHIQERDQLKIRPLWRAVFGILFIYQLMNKLKDSTSTQFIKPKFSPILLLIGWIVLFLLGSAVSQLHDPSRFILILIFLSSQFFLLLPVQKFINSSNLNELKSTPNIAWGLGLVICVVYGLILYLYDFASIN